jgi:predicted nucleic-acid-binding protein
MKGLDTNVLVRYLVDETPAQTAKVRQRLGKELEAGEEFFVATIVLCELVWVLMRAYDVRKPEMLQILEKLLGARGLAFVERDVLERSLARWKGGSGDFADYVIESQGIAAGCTSTVTFDRALLKEPGFEAV